MTKFRDDRNDNSFTLKKDTIIIKGSICKEDLEAFISRVNWGDPKGSSMKHYIYFDGLVNTQMDTNNNNCVFFKTQTQAEREKGKDREVFMVAKTLKLFQEYMKQWQEIQRKGGL